MSRLTEEQRRLVEAHADAAWALVRGLAARRPAQADAVRSAAHWGLCRAALNYVDDGTPFMAFARHHVLGAARSALRRGPADVGDASLALAGLDDGCDAPGWEAEAEDAFEGLLRHLDDRSRHLLRAHVLFGWPLSRAGELLGITESAASKLLASAIKRLRRAAFLRRWRGQMGLDDAREMLRRGVPFHDVEPHVPEADRPALREWYVREPGVPNLAARRPPPGDPTGDFCKCGGPLIQTGSCKTCSWGCGYSSGGCG